MQLMPGHRDARAARRSDTQVVPGMVVFGGAGGRGNEGRAAAWMASASARRSTAPACRRYIADVGNAQEVTMTTSGGLGEAEVGGPTMNIVPKEGGNTRQRQLLRRGRHRGHGRQQLHATSCRTAV